MQRTSAVLLAWGLTAIAGIPALAQDVARGEQVYGARKCAVCHAIAGKGNARGPLDDVGSRLSIDDLRMWIVDAKTMTAKTGSTRKPAMPSYTLPEEDLEALVAYVAALRKK